MKERTASSQVRLEPVAFCDILGWEDDDHAAALSALLRSCRRDCELRKEAREALLIGEIGEIGETGDGAAARRFFETHFIPHGVVPHFIPHGVVQSVVQTREPGFLTGYFEPEYEASRIRTDRFCVPLYRRPPDLVQLVEDHLRGHLDGALTAARQTPDGLLAYPTRAEIDQGGLDAMNLAFAWMASPVERFILQVQGSGRLCFEDGAIIRVGYEGKNGHPYTSIGRVMVARGILAAAEATLDRLCAWLEANPEDGREIMWQNKSFIFFRPLDEKEGRDGPLGAEGAALTPGRSLAVDAGYHQLGMPIWVAAHTLDIHGQSGFRRLMIAQDVGSAIKGPERGDIFWGTGTKAGRLAGATRHPGQFIVLIPKEPEGHSYTH